MQEIQLKVANRSDPGKVAGSIVKNMREGKKVSLSAIGAGAVNQGVKAVAIARSMLSANGRDILIAPGFSDQEINGVHKTAIVFYLREG